ncbi:MAG: hypothetical protein IBJ18_12420 [Phycisphaerales bacterium]|nr:hypothetical protein [Phycisphaerales bacterium]
MAQPPGMVPLPPIGAQMYGLRPYTGMTFFPELRYRGCRVTPVFWHATATEPLLLVHMTQEDLDFSKYFVKPPNRTGHEIKRAMEADGWSWDLREDGYRYLHVDELEKIEGQPPESSF